MREVALIGMAPPPANADAVTAFNSSTPMCSIG
jgi:hypothetical protein